MAAAGTTVKVNTVLVPGINDRHIRTIAKTVAELGAHLYNIIPLIPQASLRDYPTPSCHELNLARQQAEPYIDVFRHCQHCRADAVGIPGVSEYGREVYGESLGELLTAGETFSHG